MSTEDVSAPKPKAFLRIGVTGHRPGPKLSPDQAVAVRARVDAILAEIAQLTRAVVERDAWAFASRRPELSVVSALAEGADRIVAQAGLDAGMGLSAILPFARAEYRTDYATEASRAEYDALLAKSSAVFELDGKRENANRAYEAAGLLMLANADIVIAIWDQMPAEGIGGTALIVEQATAADVPVILIDPRTPDAPAILWRADSALPTAREGIEFVPRRPLGNLLASVIDIVVGTPRDPREREPLQALLKEKPSPWNIAVAYPVMLYLLGVRQLRWSDFYAPLHEDTGMRWGQHLQRQLGDPTLGAIDTDTLHNAYAFIDQLSIRYAQIYRSAYVFNYIAGAAAVLLASIGLIYPAANLEVALEFKAVMVAIEIGLITSILITLNLGTRRQWHRRWLQYRRLAETLRQLKMLSPTAAAARLDRPSDRAGRAYGWVSWYARAVEREIPVPNIAVSPAYLAAVRDAVNESELKGQVSWNDRNVHAMEKAGHRLHLAGTFLFWATLIICIAFLVVYLYSLYEKSFDLAEHMREPVVFLTALFPAIGAALSAIRSQADFETVARRSHETARDLDELVQALDREPLEFARLTDRIEKAVDVMMADNAEWHVLFRTRPLSLPA
ncbi:MAG: hypothetical protein JO346_07170 [Alphaproteobacteria bacterium]|nr:hypothetical protein [Alphaproteobacteria bacterium]